jgi:exosome complex component RRP42
VTTLKLVLGDLQTGMYSPVSSSEREYIRQGCEEGTDIRADARKGNDHRAVSVETGIFPHLNGSARVQIGGDTDVLCSIKAEVVDEKEERKSTGPQLEVSAEFSPSCNLKLDERKLADVGLLLSQHLQRILKGSLTKSDTFVSTIVPGKCGWRIYVDLVITRVDGDPLDACSMAVYAALQTTKIPRLELLTGPSGVPNDFEVVGDVSAALDFPAEQVPLCITLAKIGNVFIVDASSSEHYCASVAITVALDRDGVCCGMFKLHGHGAFSEQELNAAFNKARSITPSLFKHLDAHIAEVKKERH